jgi:hypothetical protein
MPEISSRLSGIVNFSGASSLYPGGFGGTGAVLGLQASNAANNKAHNRGVVFIKGFI